MLAVETVEAPIVGSEGAPCLVAEQRDENKKETSKRDYVDEDLRGRGPRRVYLPEKVGRARRDENAADGTVTQQEGNEPRWMRRPETIKREQQESGWWVSKKWLRRPRGQTEGMNSRTRNRNLNPV
jgi:hypothetical protein